MLAHLGGDEFAVLLPHADAARARKIAENIVEAVGPQVVKVGDQSVRVTIDVGVALFDEREEARRAAAHTVAEPPPAAPAAEPAAGDNLPAPVPPFADDGPASTALAPADGIVDRIRKALAEDGFVLYAQPIIDLMHERGDPVRAAAAHEGRVRPPDAARQVPARRPAGRPDDRRSTSGSSATRSP